MSHDRQRQGLVVVGKETRGVDHLLACRFHPQSHPRHYYCSLHLASDVSLLLGVYRLLCKHHLLHPRLQSPLYPRDLTKEALRPAPEQVSCGHSPSCALETPTNLKILHDSDDTHVRL